MATKTPTKGTCHGCNGNDLPLCTHCQAYSTRPGGMGGTLNLCPRCHRTALGQPDHPFSSGPLEEV